MDRTSIVIIGICILFISSQQWFQQLEWQFRALKM